MESNKVADATEQQIHKLHRLGRPGGFDDLAEIDATFPKMSICERPAIGWTWSNSFASRERCFEGSLLSLGRPNEGSGVLKNWPLGQTSAGRRPTCSHFHTEWTWLPWHPSCSQISSCARSELVRTRHSFWSRTDPSRARPPHGLDQVPTRRSRPHPLNGAKFLVVANREPYIHRYRDGEIEWIRPAGGLTTALDPVMRACGGTWVAHGSGDADRDAAGPDGRVGVPPDDPTYVLRRVWLTKEEEEGYYYGFANSTLWPLCHQVYQRPTFDADHWRAYRDVNQKFADAVLEEAADGPALVFVQDYHFALLPGCSRTPGRTWSWPSSGTSLAAPGDVPGLPVGGRVAGRHARERPPLVPHPASLQQLPRHRGPDGRVSDRAGPVRHRLRRARDARPSAPISVDPTWPTSTWARPGAAGRGLARRYRLGDRPVLVGVDRVDYTKGIPERLAAVERLLDTRRELKGKFHFVQVGAPSRTHLPAYRDLNEEVQAIADRINWRHGSAGWQPVVFLNEHLGPEAVYTLYRMAAGCVVSSLHDGMNLVAKEFVTARGDDRGVLVLSKFTGAARELTDAVLVNPNDTDGLAAGLYLALTMPPAEQERRMRRMRAQVADHNIYRWAGMLLSEAGRLAGSVPDRSPADDFETPSRIGAGAWAIST